MKQLWWKRLKGNDAPRSARRAAGVLPGKGPFQFAIWTPDISDLQARFEALLKGRLPEFVAGAESIAKAAQVLGVGPASPEDKLRLAGQGNQRAIDLADDVARGLARCPEAAAATGEDAAGFELDLRRGSELTRARAATDRAEQHLSGTQRTLATWQQVAQRAITARLFADLASPDLSPAEREQLVVDGAEILDLEHGTLTNLARARAAGEAQRAQTGGELHEAESLGSLLETMAALRERRPVPEQRLTEAARYYAGRLQSTRAAPAPKRPGPRKAVR